MSPQLRKIILELYAEHLARQGDGWAQGLRRNTTFQDRFKRECLEGSAIAPALYDVAISYVADEGNWEPQEALGLTVSRFWQTRQPHDFGELACFQQESCELWQAKPENPRSDAKGKEQRYEFPKGKGASAYLPPVTVGVWMAVARRNHCTAQVPQWVLDLCFVDENEVAPGFWDWVAETIQVELVPTEGGKKALSLLSQGYAAISLVGVNGGYRTKDALGNPIHPQLIPSLKRFCQSGRRVLLAFDQDTNPKTRRRVTGAQFRFGGLLATADCKVRLAQWDSSQGKGVDDLIAAHGPDAFHETVSKAFTLDEFRLKLALENQLAGITPDIHLSASDLACVDPDSAPEMGILAIVAAKGGRKTWLIEKIINDGPVVNVGHRIALTRNLCKRFGIAYRGDLDRANGRFVDGSGYVLRVGTVVDSLLAINPVDFSGCDLILDEVVQVLRHLLLSSTCNKEGMRPALIARFGELVRAAKRVILADADLDKASIQYIQSLRGGEKIWLLKNDHKPVPYPCTFIEAPDATAITARLLSAVQAGQKIFVATDSKASSKRLERLVAQLQRAGCRVLLVNSESSGGELERLFIENPDKNQDYDIVIATPSMATGVSIEADHFDAVFGLFYGASSTDADMSQALARVRKPIPRVVWCAQYGRNFSKIGRDPNPIRLKKLLQDKTNATAQLLAANLGSLKGAIEGIDYTDPTLQLWSEIQASQNRSMLSLRSALKVRLIHEGQDLTIETLDTCGATKALLKQARDDIKQMEANAISDAANLTPVEKAALEKSEALSPDEQLALRKWMLAEFYAVPLDAVSPDLVLEDNDGRLRSQIRNYEEFLDEELAAENDRKGLERQYAWSQGVTPWDMNHALLKRRVRLELGLANYIEGEARWDESRLANFKAKALAISPQVKAALNISLRQDMTANQILGQLLDQLGLKTESRQYRASGRRTREYWLNLAEQAKLIDIIQRRSERRKAQSSSDEAVTGPGFISTNTNGCDNQNPPNRKIAPPPPDLTDVRAMIQEAEEQGAGALEALQLVFEPEIWALATG